MNIKAETEAFCGVSIDENGFSACPFAGVLHDTGSGARACRWTWSEKDGMPHVKCLHAKCQDAWQEKIVALYKHLRALQKAERGDSPRREYDPKSAPLPSAPTRKPERSVPFDEAAALRLADRCRLADASPHLLRMLSPVAIPDDHRDHGALLIDSLYKKGEHVLVFDRFTSQGNYLHTAGSDKFYTLANEPGVTAKPCHRLPHTGPEGVWYLCAPVLGTWQPNPHKRDAHGNAMPGRRHTACCTRFPYLVLESDVLSPEAWFRILVQLQAPIAAVYTSGGKSVHALVAVNARTSEEFNLAAQNYKKLSRIGADPAAISAVRLTRLPGCWRRGKKNREGKYEAFPQPRMQELLYLDPNPSAIPLQDRL